MKIKLPISCLLAALALCVSAQEVKQPNKSSEPKPEAIKELLPLLGHVVTYNAPITKDGKMNSDLLQMTFQDGRGKLTNLLIDKLKLSKPGSSFVRLPEVVTEVDTWPLRPDHIDWVPGKRVTWEELKRILGTEFKKEETSEIKGQPPAFTKVDWCRYGRWSFGGPASGVDVVRVYFPDMPKKDKEEPKK